MEFLYNLEVVVDQGTELIWDVESTTILGKIVYKTIKDIACGTTLFIGLWFISGTWKIIALCCLTIK